MLKKIISFVLSFALITSQPVFAQGVAQINLGNYIRAVSNSVAMDKFRPLHMRYFSYDMATDNFQLLLDKGDEDIDVGNGRDRSLQEKTKVLMDYFKIGLSLPNEKFWVNLRPDAQDQIIDPLLEKTDIGKIMLEADLQLKKDTSGMTSPQTPEGKAYWDKLYKKAGELFGTENITIPTITRPWIVPGEIILRQGEDSAYIFKANMKVMLEEDYLTGRGGSRTAPTSQQYAFTDPRMKELNEYSTQLIRELIIPKLTKEVNTSKRYASLRQVFFSLVMARWFKDTFGSSGSASAPDSSYIKLIDSGDLTDLTSKESWSKTYYFNEYKKSFEKGEYNLKENITTPTGQVIRSYVSGGIVVSSPMKIEGIKRFLKNAADVYLFWLSKIPAYVRYEVGYVENSVKSFFGPKFTPTPRGGVREKQDESKPDSSPLTLLYDKKGKAVLNLHPSDDISEQIQYLSNPNLKLLDGIKILILYPNISLTKGQEDEIVNAAKENIFPLTIVKLSVAKVESEGQKLSPIHFVLSLSQLYNLKEAGEPIPAFLPGIGSPSSQPKEKVEGKIIFSSLPGVRSAIDSGDQEDILVAKAMLQHPDIQYLMDVHIGQLAYYPEILDFLIEIVQEYGEIGSPKVQETLSYLKKIIEEAEKTTEFRSGPAGGIDKEREQIFMERVKLLKITLSQALKKLETSSPLGKDIGISSPSNRQPGGIDFRQMNYLVQPMGSFKDLRFGLPTLSSSALERIDLDDELNKLRDMVKNGFVPSGARVKEYLAACFQKGKIEEKQDDLLVCLAEIYRLAEEENLETSPELRESLVIVDTGKFVLLPNNQKAGLN